MSKFKRLARAAAGALLVTGVLAGFASPAPAVADDANSASNIVRIANDTGWD
jgi:hypothetical protein